MPDTKDMPLRSRRERTGRVTVWYGTRQQLRDAGIVTATTVLPGDPGSIRRTYLEYRDAGPGEIARAWTIPNGRLAVRIRFTAEDEAVEDEKDARHQRRWSSEQVARDLADLEKGWPKSHEDFRRHQAEFMRIGIGALMVTVGSTVRGGYRYADDVRSEVELHLQIVRGLIETGRTVFDPEARAANLAERRATVARSDGGFRGFLDRLGATGEPSSKSDRETRP